MPDELPPFLAKILGFYCHRLPERLLTAGGVTTLFCARCTGLYTGVFIATLATAIAGRAVPLTRPVLALSALAVAACAFDAMDTAVLYATTNATRLASGFLAGLALGAVGWGLVGRRAPAAFARYARRWVLPAVVLGAAVISTLIVNGGNLDGPEAVGMTALAVGSGVGWGAVNALVLAVIASLFRRTNAHPSPERNARTSAGVAGFGRTRT